jgi:F0F1-type ATP synthase membrane subunit b/b'
MATGARPQGQACSEKLNLATDYQTYAAQYSRAVKTLREQMGVLSKAGYEDLLRYTEEAREHAEKARLALNQHTREHGC